MCSTHPQPAAHPRVRRLYRLKRLSTLEKTSWPPEFLGALLRLDADGMANHVGATPR